MITIIIVVDKTNDNNNIHSNNNNSINNDAYEEMHIKMIDNNNNNNIHPYVLFLPRANSPFVNKNGPNIISRKPNDLKEPYMIESHDCTKPSMYQ